MYFTAEHPIGRADCEPDLYGPAGLPLFAQTAERAGFTAIAFTEHPAPSLKWLRGGGHATLDPVAALSFVAASTTSLAVMPYLLVLPYRNPLLAAKSIVSLDVLSGGRLIVAAGGGYLRSEFSALGADFDERGALFDEALEVLSGVCTNEEFHYAGSRFSARGVTMVPGPAQRPHPPVWIGGNGRNARRRVARFGQGWSPLVTSEEVAATTRMPAITDVTRLADYIDDLRQLVAEAGRDPASIAIQVLSPHSALVEAAVSAERLHDHIGELAGAGVTHFVVRTPAHSVAAATGALTWFGEEFIEKEKTP
ncbi:TIGR03619 family F420-dependent LLM class oxidoreductase [Mycobacterium sp.]|uniref:TIGR03619 family F420-dependent LLM class oxidoreductase n=1 Tax=Mycobacterium sp. TaxID=1785 RepID=UPI0011F598FD|nr:TIGR03619 family F420-dependent LLM class oxidoreductase [Mycobacterium sp.]TAM64532.1 MAG: TIGR03619 family F420-dependent LLM class oxidoreductase [Mycobacterium sp.]